MVSLTKSFVHDTNPAILLFKYLTSFETHQVYHRTNKYDRRIRAFNTRARHFYRGDIFYARSKADEQSGIWNFRAGFKCAESVAQRLLGGFSFSRLSVSFFPSFDFAQRTVQWIRAAALQSLKLAVLTNCKCRCWKRGFSGARVLCGNFVRVPSVEWGFRRLVGLINHEEIYIHNLPFLGIFYNNARIIVRAYIF